MMEGPGIYDGIVGCLPFVSVGKAETLALRDRDGRRLAD